VPLINASAIARCRKLAALAAAIAAAPLFVGAVAHAEPEPIAPAPDPRAECEAPEFGGVFVTANAAHSECQYIVEGYFYYDNYDNGAYTGTLVYRDGAKVPTERPVMPESLNMPGGGSAPVIPFPMQF
jgi:hypothetical protein